MTKELIERLYASDAASALTNEAAREIEALAARVAELEKLAEVNASIERHLKDQRDKLQDQAVHWEMTCGNLTAGLKRKDALLRGCIGIMNPGPYVDAVLVRGAVEAITKELTP